MYINGFNFQNKDLIQKMNQSAGGVCQNNKEMYLSNDVSFGWVMNKKTIQPIWNENRTICLICDGSIYNFLELKKNLLKKNHKFNSNLDVEVILHLYEEKGAKCLKEINGIFAMAIFDKNNKRLFLAKDRVGVKPIYYYFKNHKFIFSSSIKAILAHKIDKQIDKEAISYYFQLFFAPSPYTLFKHINKLPPAHYLIYENQNLTIQKYWDIQDCAEIISERDGIEKIQFLFKDSVKRRIPDNQSLGVFLSGGIDSTSVLGAICEYSTKPVKTYSIGFDIAGGEDKFNRDFYFARQTSQYYKTDHREFLMTSIDARNYFEKVIKHMEEPVSNPTQIATFLLAQQAGKEVDIVFGGDGGDEVFGGYARYYHSKLLNQYQALPHFLRKNILPNFLELILRKENLKEKLNIPSGLKRHLLFRSQKTKILSQVLTWNAKRELVEDFLKKNYFDKKFNDKEKYLMFLDLLFNLPDESLIRSHKMTSACGIEQRMPLLDYRLIELAFRIPTKYKVRGKKKNKWIFQQAMKGYLPSHILNKEKRGWFSPASQWLRTGLKDFSYEVLSSEYCPETQEYFNFYNIRKILDNHISKKEYNLDIIWSLLTFQLWYKIFIKKF